MLGPISEKLTNLIKPIQFLANKRQFQLRVSINSKFKSFPVQNILAIKLKLKKEKFELSGNATHKSFVLHNKFFYFGERLFATENYVSGKVRVYKF